MKTATHLLALSAALAVAPLRAPAADPTAWATRDVRAGIIGTDTSHVPAFTAQFNKAHPEWRVKGSWLGGVDIDPAAAADCLPPPPGQRHLGP